MLIQTVTNIGATFGALFGGPVASAFGRWKAIIICNVILLIGCGCQFYPNLYVFTVGRLIYGYSAGLFSFLTPKYISETSPVEVSGMLGGVSQLACTFGILMPMSLSPMYKDNGNNDTFIYIIFALPFGMAIFQLLFLFTVFRFDTPPQLKKKGDMITLRKLISNIYVPEAVDSRIDQIQGGDANVEQVEEKVTLGMLLTHPNYKRAFLIGCSLAMFQQLTGINILMFYSSAILGGAGISP